MMPSRAKIIWELVGTPTAGIAGAVFTIYGVLDQVLGPKWLPIFPGLPWYIWAIVVLLAVLGISLATASARITELNSRFSELEASDLAIRTPDSCRVVDNVLLFPTVTVTNRHPEINANLDLSLRVDLGSPKYYQREQPIVPDEHKVGAHHTKHPRLAFPLVLPPHETKTGYVAFEWRRSDILSALEPNPQARLDVRLVFKELVSGGEWIHKRHFFVERPS